MLLIIDNYDSFTFNLAQYFQQLGVLVQVKRNDEITIDQICKLKPQQLVISPGPSTPDDAGISLEVIKKFAGIIPILGVCLGHQAIAQAFGVRVIPAKQVMHGKTSSIMHNKDGLFAGLSNPLTVTRYHSLLIENVPTGFTLDAWFDRADQTREIMAISNKNKKLYGVQFHPESILTQQGHQLLSNFLNLYPK